MAGLVLGILAFMFIAWVAVMIIGGILTVFEKPEPKRTWPKSEREIELEEENILDMIGRSGV